MLLEKSISKKSTLSWSLFDWANSAFTTIILTFVYGTYFTKSVASDPALGSMYWSYAVAVSGFLILLLSPICGALADYTGRLKLWIGLTTVLCISGTLVLTSAAPQSTSLALFMALGGLVIANLGFELGQVFYNALLPNVASLGDTGRVSSLAWGLGYAGGLVSLVVALFGFIGLGGYEPFLSLPKDDAWHIRGTAVLVAAWFAIFSLPFFLNVPDKAATDLSFKDAWRKSAAALSENFRTLKTDRKWRNFLIGSALYRDGLNTLFALGGIYAAIRYDLETPQILMFGIGMNVTAGLGCWLSSRFEDRLGSFRTIRIALCGLLLLGCLILLAKTATWFFIFALALGLFVGPLQSCSRTIVVHLSRPESLGGYFGFYALTGRAASFLGPLFYGLAVQLSGQQNAGLCVILILWLAGLFFVRGLKHEN